MPELPEVETIRLGLLKRVLHTPITDVEVRQAKITRGGHGALRAALVGSSFADISRRGKLLIFSLTSGGRFVLVHLKMTGQLIYERGAVLIAGGHTFPTLADPLPNKYSHVIISFADGGKLFFNDMRQFGYMELADEARLAAALAPYGPEPLEPSFTFEVFNNALGKRTIAIKAALLNQHIIAGIGNIYADESLFEAGIRPGRRVNSLKVAEKKALQVAIVKILHKAMKYGGTTFSEYRDADGQHGNFTSLLKVYGRGGEMCVRCKKTVLKKVKIAARGTVFCPYCQA